MFFTYSILLLSTLHLRVCSQVIYAYPTGDCTTEGPMPGNSVYCCSGACLDGTRIGEAGQCENWLDLCGDVDSPPSCSYNQVLSSGDPGTVDSGDGCCGACCCECQYQRNSWTWSCCDCPAGFIAVDAGTCGGTSNPSCVGCQEPDQTLTGDASTGFQCAVSSSTSTSTLSMSSTMSMTPSTSMTTSALSRSISITSSSPSSSNTVSSSLTNSATSNTNTLSSVASPSNAPLESGAPSATGSALSATPSYNACDKARAVDDAVNRISTLSTEFGGWCPTSDIPSSLISIGESAIAGAQSSTDNSEGFATSVNNAARGFLIGAAVLLGVTADLPVAAGLATAYQVACTANTLFGAVATLAGVGMDAVARAECGVPISKRFISRLPTTSSRDTLYNSCSELLAYFPGDTTFPNSLDQACTLLYSDTTYTNITGNLQQACHRYQDSSDSTFMIEFSNFLTAVRNFEPYCETKTAESSTSASSGTNTGTSSSSKTYPLPSAVETFSTSSGAGQSGILQTAAPPSSVTTTSGLSNAGQSGSNASPLSSQASYMTGTWSMSLNASMVTGSEPGFSTIGSQGIPGTESRLTITSLPIVGVSVTGEGASASTLNTYICGTSSSLSQTSPAIGTALTPTDAVGSGASPLDATPTNSAASYNSIVVSETPPGRSLTGGTMSGIGLTTSASSTTVASVRQGSAATSLDTATAFNIVLGSSILVGLILMV